MFDRFDHKCRVYVCSRREEFDVLRRRRKEKIEVKEATHCEMLRSDDGTPRLRVKWEGQMSVAKMVEIGGNKPRCLRGILLL